MKYGVNRQVLLITAGIVWIIAGANLLRIGIVTWLNDSRHWHFKVGEATVVFLLFFILVFRKLYYKQLREERQKKLRKRKRKRIAPSLFSTQRDGLSCAS